MSLQFDEETHAYTLNGSKVPSVTTVITDMLGSGYDFLSPADSEWYMMRGRAIHAYAELIANKKPFAAPDERIAGHVSALHKFFAVASKVHLVEYRVANPVYGYAGTLDLLCEIGGAKCLVDFKSSLNESRVALQLGAYNMALPKAYQTNKAYGVELNEDGTFKMYRVENLQESAREFIVLLSAYKIKQKVNGRK